MRGKYYEMRAMQDSHVIPAVSSQIFGNGKFIHRTFLLCTEISRGNQEKLWVSQATGKPKRGKTIHAHCTVYRASEE